MLRGYDRFWLQGLSSTEVTDYLSITGNSFQYTYNGKAQLVNSTSQAVSLTSLKSYTFMRFTFNRFVKLFVCYILKITKIIQIK